MKTSRKIAVGLVPMIALLAACAGSQSIGGGLWGMLGGQAGVSSLVHGFAGNLTKNAAVASALGQSGVEGAKMGLYNSIAAAGGYTIEKGADLQSALAGKNLSPEIVTGIGASLTEAAKEQRLGAAQLEGLKQLWQPVEKALLAGK